MCTDQFIIKGHTNYIITINSLGIFGQSCNSFSQMHTDLSIVTGHTNYIIAISYLGIFGQFCNSFIQMYTNLSIITGQTNYIITKSTSIIILTTYYTFCMRNKPWTIPDLLSYQQFLFSHLALHATITHSFSCLVKRNICA